MPQIMEHAVWYDAETERNPIASIRDQIDEVMGARAAHMMVELGETEFSILKPGDDRVPEVPKWLENTKNSKPRLLVAHAPILGPAKRKEEPNLVGDLDPKDLAILRGIVKRSWKRHFPDKPDFEDHEADTIINYMGMDVVMDSLRKFKASQSKESVVVLHPAKVANDSKIILP